MSKTCNEMPRTAHLSPPCLKANFLRQVGVLPRGYIYTIKVECAKEIFAQGFSSANYFSRLFRKFTGANAHAMRACRAPKASLLSPKHLGREAALAKKPRRGLQMPCYRQYAKKRGRC